MKWFGSEPKKCDLCNKDFKKFFIDGKTVMGQWGLLCQKCHFESGVGLGVGRGQKYDLKTKVKVEG
jgi:hypothetical protein